MSLTARIGAVVMATGFIYVVATRASNAGCLLGVALMLAGALSLVIAIDRREQPSEPTPNIGGVPRPRGALLSAPGSVSKRTEEPISANGQVVASGEREVVASLDREVVASVVGAVVVSADGAVVVSADR